MKETNEQRGDPSKTPTPEHSRGNTKGIPRAHERIIYQNHVQKKQEKQQKQTSKHKHTSTNNKTQMT